jgi:hypothetical protein
MTHSEVDFQILMNRCKELRADAEKMAEAIDIIRRDFELLLSASKLKPTIWPEGVMVSKKYLPKEGE